MIGAAACVVACEATVAKPIGFCCSGEGCGWGIDEAGMGMANEGETAARVAAEGAAAAITGTDAAAGCVDAVARTAENPPPRGASAAICGAGAWFAATVTISSTRIGEGVSICIGDGVAFAGIPAAATLIPPNPRLPVISALFTLVVDCSAV